MNNLKIKTTFLVLVSVIAGFFSIITPALALQPPGTHIRTSDGTVYYMTNQNSRRPYTSWGAFISYRNNRASDAQPAGSDDLTLPVGNFIQPREGTIICSDRFPDQGTCYLMSQGQKLGFTSEQVFTCLGYSFRQSFSGDVSWMPTGSLIGQCAMAHPVGTAISLNGATYLVGADGLYAVQDETVFESWGYNTEDVVPGNSYDQNLAHNKILTARPAGYVGPFWQSPSNLSFNPFGGQTITAPSAPVISFTVNNQTQIVVHTGQTYTYQWNITGADSMDSFYQATASDSCSNPYSGSGTAPWDATQISGSITRTADACRENKTYTITLRAHKSGTADASSSVQIIFRP